MDVNIEASWKKILHTEFTKSYFENIVAFLKTEKAQGKIIYPPGALIFNAFSKTPFDKLKIVLLGQDPYHGKGQAMGLSFSVPKGVRPPPSLINIFKELHDDVGMPVSSSGDLTSWAEQGVLLLNAALTVRANEAKLAFKNWLAPVYRCRYKKSFWRKRRNCFFIMGCFRASETRIN